MGSSGVYAKSGNAEAFWREAAKEVFWFKEPDLVLERQHTPSNRWFVGGVTNSCFNALDLHVGEGLGDQLALICESPGASRTRSITYCELLELVSRFAGALASLRVAKGDRVIVYMPPIPEAVIAMLACARIGAIHCVMSGRIAATELARRMTEMQPKVVVAASCGVEPRGTIPYGTILDAAIDLSPWKPRRRVILQRDELPFKLGWRDVEWNRAMRRANAVDCAPLIATDPLYALYAAAAKCLTRDNGGHLVALTWGMRHLHRVEAGEVCWSPCELASILGHSYGVYAPLFAGCTTVLVEGPVDRDTLDTVITRHHVSVMFDTRSHRATRHFARIIA